MAKRKSIYQKRREEAHKKALKSFSSDSSSFDIGKNIENYKTRLSGAGIDPSEATDKRNWLEKKLNLPEDQNVLFDVAEIIGRPQQALLGAIKESQEGGSALEGAKAGISGEEDYYAGDILRNLGVSDKKIFTGPLSGEDRSLADILGTGLDIFADPVDLIPGGALVKAGKVAGATSDLNKAKKALKAVEATEDATKIAEATKKVDKAADALKTVKGTKYKASLLEAGVQGAVGGIKRVAGVGDKLITKGLEKLDDKTYYNAIRQIGVDNGLLNPKNVKKLSKTELDNVADVLIKRGVKLDDYINNLGDVYSGAKKGIARTADYAKSMPSNLYNKINRADNKLDAVKLQGESILKDIDKNVDNYAKKYGVNADDIKDDVNTLISSKYKKETNGYDFIEKALSEGKATITGTPKEIENFREGFKKLNRKDQLVDDLFNFKMSKDGTTLTLKPKNKKGLSNVLHNNANNDILKGIKHIQGEKLSPEVESRINELKKLYESNSDFKDLVDYMEPSYRTINELLNSATDESIDFIDMMREGFTRNTKTDYGKSYLKEASSRRIGLQSDDVNIGSKAVTGAKKNSNVALEGERQIHEKINKELDKKISHRDNIKMYDEKVKDLEAKIAENKSKKDDIKKSFKKNLNKLNLDKNEKQIDVKDIQEKLDNVKNIVEDTLKKSEYIVDEKLPEKLIKNANEYTDTISELDRIETKLADPNLTEKEIKKLWNSYENTKTKLVKKEQALYFEKARIDGSLLKKQEKNISKAVTQSIDSSSKYTKGLIDSQSKLDKTLSKIESVKAGYNKTVKNIEKRINNYNLELDRLKNMTEEEIIKYNKDAAKKIAKEQRDIDFLQMGQGIQFYETSYTKGLGDFINVTVEDAKNINRYNEILLHAGLNDESVLKFIPKGERVGKVPTGYAVLRKEEVNDMISFLENKKNFLPNDSELISELKSMVNDSGAILIDKDLKSMLKLNFDEKEVKPFVRMIDKFNNIFKKFKVMTPGFHLRNIAGNSTNMVMSGVPLANIPGLYKEANKLTDKKYIVDLFSKKALGTSFTTKEAKDFELINKFMEGGFLGKGKDIQDLGELVDKTTKNVNKNALEKIVDGIFTGNMNLNEWVDNRNRMALLIYAERNPKYLAKLGVNDSIGAVKKVLFDPNNLSDFEKNTLKRIVPFYTFTKQNLMFHADNIMKNTSRYKRLVKTFDETYDSLPDDTYKPYQKENMQIPIGLDSEGNVSTLKTNLPVSDLGEYIENPLQRLVSSTSPLIKAPFEAVTGKDVFTGQDLYKSTPDQLASWLGIDTITTSQVNKIKNLYSDLEDNTSAQKYISDLLPSVMQYNDSEKIANQQQYEELLAYQEYVKQLKAQGIDIPTIKELTSSTNNSLKAVRKRRTAYQKRRSS